jgi:hypothetical protein
MQLQGEKLVKFVMRNPGKSGKQLAELAGYASTTKTGRDRINMMAFQNAMLAANNITFNNVEDSESKRSGRKASHRIQVQQNGNLLIGAAYTRQMGLIPGTEFEIQTGRKHIKLVQVERSLEPEILELLYKKEVDKFSDQELRKLINYSAPPFLDEKFYGLLDLNRADALSPEEKDELNRMMDLYDIGMQKKSQAIDELYKRGITL